MNETNPEVQPIDPNAPHPAAEPTPLSEPAPTPPADRRFNPALGEHDLAMQATCRVWNGNNVLFEVAVDTTLPMALHPGMENNARDQIDAVLQLLFLRPLEAKFIMALQAQNQVLKNPETKDDSPPESLFMETIPKSYPSLVLEPPASPTPPAATLPMSPEAPTTASSDGDLPANS